MQSGGARADPGAFTDPCQHHACPCSRALLFGELEALRQDHSHCAVLHLPCAACVKYPAPILLRVHVCYRTLRSPDPLPWVPLLPCTSRTRAAWVWHFLKDASEALAAKSSSSLSPQTNKKLKINFTNGPSCVQAVAVCQGSRSPRCSHSACASAESAAGATWPGRTKAACLSCEALPGAGLRGAAGTSTCSQRGARQVGAGPCCCLASWPRAHTAGLFWGPGTGSAASRTALV